MTSRLKSATTGWWLLVGYVIAWDWLVAGKMKGETLTGGFHRARQGRLKGHVAAVWTITTLHLFGLLPPRLDPFSWLARAVTG